MPTPAAAVVRELLIETSGLPVDGVLPAVLNTILDELAAPIPYPGRLLGRGLVGDDIRQLQQFLNDHGTKPRLKVDGIFGPRTLRAVLLLQRQAKLRRDGIVGPRTWAAGPGRGAAAPAAPQVTPPMATPPKVTPPKATPPPRTAPPGTTSPPTQKPTTTTTARRSTTTTVRPTSTSAAPATAAPTMVTPTTTAATTPPPTAPATTTPAPSQTSAPAATSTSSAAAIVVTSSSSAPRNTPPTGVAAPSPTATGHEGLSGTALGLLIGVSALLVLAVAAVALGGRRRERAAAPDAGPSRWRATNRE
jgi:peptidoglycan hydrolase-like protein with peptidoglycan-binding domain